MDLPKKIIGLDILRFVMAIVMVVYHVQASMENSFFNLFGLNGFYGTSIFFILSGFILTHVYQNKILSQHFSNSTFLIKRFSALYPIHIITILISIVFFFTLITLTGKQLPIEIALQALPQKESTGVLLFDTFDILLYTLESIFLVQAWDHRLLFLNGAAWSVSALFFFYLVFPFFVKQINKINKLFLALFILWLLYLSLPIFLIITQNYSSEAIGFLHRNPLFRLPEFISGILFYNICLKKKTYQSNYQTVCFLVGLIGFIACYFLVKSNTEIWFYLSHNGMFLFCQLALIYSFLNITINNHKIRSYLERLGKASLTIYMIHLPLLGFYFIAYRLTMASFEAHSFSEIILIAKNI